MAALRASNSFRPQVFGLYLVKLATAVVLAGGVERVDQSGTRVRGDPHLVSKIQIIIYFLT